MVLVVIHGNQTNKGFSSLELDRFNPSRAILQSSLISLIVMQLLDFQRRKMNIPNILPGFPCGNHHKFCQARINL